MGTVLGLITIGQTPRLDLEAEFQRYSPQAEILMLGALDGLKLEEVAALDEPGDDYPLHVRLASGATANVPLAVLAPLVEDKARQLAFHGADLVVVLCAGGFPDFDCSAPLLLPGRVVPAVAGSLSRRRRIGVVTPIEGQVKAARSKWEADGFYAEVTAASPSRHEEIHRAAADLTGADLDLIVLDCIGHDEAYRKDFVRLCPVPVLLAQTLVARVAGEVLDGCAQAA